MPDAARIVAAGDSDPIQFFGMSMDWKATGARTSGAMALVEAVGSPGTEPPLHFHESSDEFFYVISGDMTFRVGDEMKLVTDGGFVWIPRQTIHGFTIHRDNARFLFAFTPAGPEQMFLSAGSTLGEVSDSVEDRRSDKANSGAASHRARFGTVVVGPRLGQEAP